MKKRLLSVLIVFLMVFTMIPAAAMCVYADEGDSDNEAEHDTYKQTLEIGTPSLTVIIGQKEKIDVDHEEGDGELVFSSDNEEIATVDPQGNVVGIKEGVANISVYARETVEYKQSETEIIKVTVTAPPKVSKSVKISGRTIKIKRKKLKKKSLKLSPSKVFKLSPKTAMVVSCVKIKGNKKIKVNPNNGSVTVKKGLKKGTYKVKVTVEVVPSLDNDCRIQNKKVTFKIKVK